MARKALLVILGLIVLGILLNDLEGPTPGTKATADKGASPRALNVSISKMNWRKGGFGAVMILTVTIENKEDFAVKDIDIACELSAKSGTTIGVAANTIYDTVPAQERLTVRELNMGSGVTIDFNQADRAFCKLGAMSRA